MKRIATGLSALATVALAAGLLTSTAEAGPAAKSPGATKGEWLHFNNAAHNNTGFGDTLQEVRNIAGFDGYPGGPLFTWEEGGRTHKVWFFPGENCPSGNTSEEFAEYANSWKLENKSQTCWDGISNDYPYPDN